MGFLFFFLVELERHSSCHTCKLLQFILAKIADWHHHFCVQVMHRLLIEVGMCLNLVGIASLTQHADVMQHQYKYQDVERETSFGATFSAVISRSHCMRGASIDFAYHPANVQRLKKNIMNPSIFQFSPPGLMSNNFVMSPMATQISWIGHWNK